MYRIVQFKNNIVQFFENIVQPYYNIIGGTDMTISATELKKNLGKYPSFYHPHIKIRLKSPKDLLVACQKEYL